MEKIITPLSDGSEERAIDNCIHLLTRLNNNILVSSNIWSKGNKESLKVDSINEYETKKVESKKKITKLVAGAVISAGLTALLTKGEVLNFIPEIPKLLLSASLGIIAIILAYLTYNAAVYNSEIKEYLKTARDYLTRFKPNLLPLVEVKKKLKK